MLSVASHGSTIEHVAIDECRDKTFTRYKYEDLANHLHRLIERDIDETDPNYATLDPE